MPTDYRLVPIDPDAAGELRAAGGERYIADATPGYPCRQCLRDADVGDALLLVAHDPFTVDSPYRSRSPIFIHEESCTPPSGVAGLPDQLTVRQLSVSAFDDDATEEIHIHNATRGCWATSVVRSS